MSKVTEFGTNRKLICDFLLVINANSATILHRLGPKSLYSATPLVFNSPDGGVPLGRYLGKFTWMSTDGQRMKWHRNIAKNFNRLSRVNERYRRQTDGGAIA